MNDSISRKAVRRRFDPARTMEILLGLVLLAILAAVILGFMPLSHPRLTKVAVAALKKNGVDSCAMGAVHITFWKGISLSGVALSGATRDGIRYSLNVPGIDARCNFFHIGIHRKDFRSLFAGDTAEFRARFRVDPAGAVTEILLMAKTKARVESLSATNARVTVEKKGKPLFSGDGISLTLSVAGEKHTCRGSFSAGGTAVSGIPIAERMEGEFILEGGCLTLSKCKGITNEGKFSCRAGLDLTEERLSALSLSVAGFDLSTCSLDDAGGGRLGGKADFRITLDSSDFRLDSLRGTGTISASPLILSEFPLQKSLVGMLAYPGLAHAHFKKFKSDFRVKPGRIIETNAQGDGDSLCVKASGWFRADGSLNEKVECIIPPKCVGALPSFAQKTLEETPDGGRGIRCRIYGMVGNPKFEIDNKIILQKAVTNMFEDMKDHLRQWLK